MTGRCIRRLVAAAGIAFTATPCVHALEPHDSPVASKAYRHPALLIPSLERPLGQLPPTSNARPEDLSVLGAGPQGGFYDWRAGRWGSLVVSRPLIPGRGVGNTLRAPGRVREAGVWQALAGYLRGHEPQLRVDLSQLAPARIGIFEEGALVHVHAPRVVDGIPVRDSGLTAVINHGNLVLLGLQAWGTLEASPRPALGPAQARAAVAGHVRPLVATGHREAERLELIPLARGAGVTDVAAGGGYDFRLAWVVTPQFAGEIGVWEGLVDAASGELLAFQDRGAYAVRRAIGGVYPVSNDQISPDGVEQAGWPMPYADIDGAGASFTTTGGQVTACERGTIGTNLDGQFIRIQDNCGAINETSAAGDLDLGFGPTPTATDCEVPSGHSPGDTKAARTVFYELNRIKEQGRAYLPGNAWLGAQLTAQTNLSGTCNAFWNGTVVQFSRGSGLCKNMGEIAGIVDHEFGHGLDDNGVNGSISNPFEGIADIRAIYRLSTSCVGRGVFTSGVCGGYGDPCLTCTGVRDADFALHQSGNPHGITWIVGGQPPGGCFPSGSPGPCGRTVQCESQIVGETAWDLQFRDLRAAPYSYDASTALEVATRILYLGAETVTNWYTCGSGSPPSGDCAATGSCGCGATGGYLLMLAADDDDGDLNNGTPHMTAIRGAFERHQIHCATTPPLQDGGCAGGPTAAPTVVATPAVGGVDLAWAPVAGAASYAVYRTEGVSACDFGKVKAGETAGTAFSDTGLLDGRTYYYGVLPVGASSPACLGRMSNCASAVPLPPVDPCVPVELQSFDVE
jgi:hypothetical protein